MKKVKKIVLTLVLFLTVTASSSLVLAQIEEKDGGHHDWGVSRPWFGDWVVWSNYHHNHHKHHSWCSSGNGKIYESGVANRGQWSKSHGGASMGSCEAWYAFDD